jgi:hypothetical protein
MQNPPQPSPPALDPLGVALSTRSFDRGDDSFGVKAGDLLVTPLGRTAEVVGVGLVHRAAMAADGEVCVIVWPIALRIRMVVPRIM